VQGNVFPCEIDIKFGIEYYFNEKYFKFKTADLSFITIYYK